MNTNVRTSQVGPQTVYHLERDLARLEVWPGVGFNALRWQVKLPHGTWGDILDSAPDWATNPVPTRSGHPILFPFPNRLAHGRMTSGGVDYQLALTEATGTHAIHGFAPRRPWTVVGSGTTDSATFLTGRFRMSESFPDARSLWPGDAELRMTYRLTDSTLAVEAVVANHGSEAMPYGLGYHAYFRHPAAPAGEPIDRCPFQCRVDQLWECDANIPTGRIVPTPPDWNFAAERPLGATVFDTLFTGLAPGAGLRPVAALRHPDHAGTVTVAADESFPHVVLFTPPHRRSIAIEPYTCATNAAHLPDSLPHGWKSLAPGHTFPHRVEYRWTP
jgi:aldose 1-epimerase